MSTRQNALQEWLTQTLRGQTFTCTPLLGDASFRRYCRVITQEKAYITMDAPPEKEGLTAFIQIARTLLVHGIRAPELIAIDAHQGFILLEDFGDTHLTTDLTSENTSKRYHAALDMLVHIQNCPTRKPLLPRFDTTHMMQEMSLFKTWFLEHLLDITLSMREEKHLKALFDTLTSHLNEQPQRFIHRDYHSRNLLVMNEQERLDIGVIDFQDAMEGPFSYDLVSLIKDCYIHWPQDTRQQWINYFYQQLPDKAGWSPDEFNHGTDWCGLQRHLKVLGIFSRLHLRDQKSAYLNDLPLTLKHTMQCAAEYDAFHALQELIEKRVLPAFNEKQPA